MTTYELPPEPPVGSKVHPSGHPDVVWYRSGHDGGWSTPGRPWYSWAQLLGKYEGQGLTLIEPDPWPTDDLIVASVDGGGAQLLMQATAQANIYVTMTGALVHPDRHTLTNVVPVTVVPIAALPVLWSALDRWNYGPGATAGDDLRWLVGAVVGLREQIDALGLDQ